MKEKEKLLGLGFVLAMVISVMMFASVVPVAAPPPEPPEGAPPFIFHISYSKSN